MQSGKVDMLHVRRDASQRGEEERGLCEEGRQRTQSLRLLTHGGADLSRNVKGLGVGLSLKS